MKWHPAGKSPVCEVGDRILGVVMERATSASPLRERIVVMEAAESGWDGGDGYIPEDCARWAYERDVLAARGALHADRGGREGEKQ